VGELEGDEAAADEQDSCREGVEIQEVGAVEKVLVSREVEGAGSGTGGDQEAVGIVGGPVDLELARTGEPRVAVQGGDTVAGQAVLHALGDRAGETVLVLHQVGPVDRQVRVVDALPRIRRALSMISAPRRRIFFGSHPRNAHVPP